jgi:hypothetical protein
MSVALRVLTEVKYVLKEDAGRDLNISVRNFVGKGCRSIMR